MRIDRVTSVAEVLDGRLDHLLDPPLPDRAAALLGAPGHHLLVAYGDDGVAEGYVLGIECLHLERRSEMFVWELGVAERARRRGVGTALVRALHDLATERDCFVMWVDVEPGDEAALATYRRAGATAEQTFVVQEWRLG